VSPATRRVAIIAAAIHLLIAAFFSTHWPVERLLPDFLERPLKLYGLYTGAQTHFNFFAPAVATQARARFVLHGRDGLTRTAELPTPSAEANQRIAMMFTFYGVPETRPFLARAWGIYMLTLHPDAVAVEVIVEALDIPPLREVRAGRPARWIEVDRAVLRRDEIS
jgi:hypothetical protein